MFLDAGRLADGNNARATLAVTAKAANFADSRIELTVSVAAVTAPAQDGAAADYLEGFTVGLRLPPGYAFGDGKSGRALSLIVSEGLADVSLSADAATDALAYAPNGVASDALPAGAHTVTVALTAADLLGTVLLEFAATVNPRPLDADQFGLSLAPATVTIAAGDGAVGLALARASLFESAAGASVVLPAAFPRNVSLALASAGREAVFYLTTALDGGSFAEPTARLTVALDANHAPLSQDAALRITVLQNPGVAVVGGKAGTGNPFESDNLYTLKAGDYVNATSFARDSAASSPQLAVDANSGIVSTSEEIAVEGIYTVVASVSSPDFVGRARLELRLMLGAENAFPTKDTIPTGQRSRSVLIARGHSGSVAFFAARKAGVTLRTPSSAPAGFNLGGGLDADFTAPAGFTLFLNAEGIADAASATLTVTARSAGFTDSPIALTVSVAAVSAPAQGALSANYNEEFAPHAPTLPAGYQAGASAVLLGIAGGADDLFALNGENAIVRNSADNTPPAGEYKITLGVTHAGFLGTLLVEVTANIHPADLNEGAYGLPQPAGVTVASGYTGYLYTDISLRALAAEGVLATPLGAFPAGVSLSLLSDSRGVAPHLTLALDEEEFRPQVTLTVSRGANYNSLEQIATLSVTALRAPPLAEASGETFGATPSFSGVVFTLAGAGYESGAYAGAYFEEKDSSSGLQVAVDGEVSTQRNLGAGDYALTVVALGRPDSRASADAFIGEAEITVSLRVTQGLEVIAADDVVLPARRHVTLDAAIGYTGRGYAISVEDGYTLSAENYDSGELGYDADAEVISIIAGNALESGRPLVLTVSGEGRCAGDVRNCVPAPVSVTAIFRVIDAPTQDKATEKYLDGFTVALKFPAGYETGSVDKPGRGTELLLREDNGCEADHYAIGGKCAALALNAAGDALEYAPTEAGDALDAGAYLFTVGMTQTDSNLEVNSLLGTVLLEVAVVVERRPLDAAAYGLSSPTRATVTVAAGAGAVGLELSRVSLSTSAAGAVVVLPAEFPGNLSLALVEGSRAAAFYLTLALGGDGNSVERTARLTVTLNGNYEPLSQDVGLRVSALGNPELAELGGVVSDSSPYVNADLYTLKAGDYANAANFARDDARSSPELAVNAESGIVSTARDITAGGVYTLAVSVTSPDFVGAARLDLRLNLVSEGEFRPEETIQTADRVRDVAVVPGYAGSVAFFAAGKDGVTLRTPAAPAGFNFGADGANRDYKAPDGFTLYLADGRLTAAGDAARAEFVVTAREEGVTDLEIGVTVSVAALASQAQATLVAGHLDADYGALTPPDAYGFDRASLRVVGVHDTEADAAVEDWAERVTVAGGRLRPLGVGAAALALGKYEVTVGMTHPGFLGTLLLSVPADIQYTLHPDEFLKTRVVTQRVADGHFSDSDDAGYVIDPGKDYILSEFVYDNTRVTVVENKGRHEVRGARAVRGAERVCGGCGGGCGLRRRQAQLRAAESDGDGDF